MSNKRIFTQQFLLLLSETDCITLDQAMVSWWQDLRFNGGLRLSFEGFQLLKQLKVEYFNFDVLPGTHARAQVLIVLNKSLECPYFLQAGKYPKIVFFGSQEAVWINLYGNIERFLENYKS
jgi:hypothetical protein